MAISDFLKMLQITKDDKDELFPEKHFKLNHIIQIYEELELQVEHIEVEGVHKKYQESRFTDNTGFQSLQSFLDKLNHKKEEANDNKTNNKEENNSLDEVYKEIETLMHVIARLCNRQLRQYHKGIATKNLFEYLSDEESNKKLFIKYSDLLRLQRDRKDSNAHRISTFHMSNRYPMMSVAEEIAISSSELHYDLDEIREVEAYFLYYQSTGV